MTEEEFEKRLKELDAEWGRRTIELAKEMQAKYAALEKCLNAVAPKIEECAR